MPFPMRLIRAYGLVPGLLAWLAGRFPRSSAPRQRLNWAAPLVYRAGEWLLDRWDRLLDRDDDTDDVILIELGEREAP